MSALRQPDFYPERYPPRVPRQKTGVRYRQVKQPQAKLTRVVQPKTFASRSTLPNNLKALSLLQKSSFGLAIASMTASIGLYISTVQIPKLWSQEYQRLENLQQQERQLIAINETIKYQIAKEAAKDGRLSISQPESAIFISPAKTESKNLSDTTKNYQEAVELEHGSYGY